METNHLITDIAGTLTISRLQNELEKENIPVDYILFAVDNFTIYYTRTLTTAENTIVQNTVANHDAETSNMNTRKIHLSKDIYAESPGFQVMAKFILDGEFEENVQSVHILSKGENYTVRLYDVNNKIILGSGSFTNTDWEINSIPLIDISDDPSQVEVQVKSETPAYLQEICINYI